MIARFWFCRSETIAGKVIRLMTMGKWNHVGIEVNDIVYDADAGRGVTTASLDIFLARYTEAEAVDVAVPKAEAFISFLKSQIGKPYDYLAILAFPFRRDWQREEAWFCSEYAAKAALVGGVLPALRLPRHKVTPDQLFFALPLNKGRA